MSKVENLVIYGKNPVKEALNKGNCLEILLVSDFSDSEILSLIKEKGIPTKRYRNTDLANICKSENHQGIAAYLKPFSYASLEEIISHAKNREHPLILMLDGIEDPHNFGAIIRCCDAFDVDGIIIKKNNQVEVNSTVMKTSAGALNYVKICKVTNLSNAIKELKNNGFWIVSTDGNAKDSYTEIKYDMPLVVVVGSEGFGVSPLILTNSDFTVKIPMLGHVNSLNASVATGIILSHIRSSK
ncbi:MAG: 23S rRNA (guanosine(2251)-2'-O)-methyltransferase RlmB [Coprobacillus sp.]|nr:23S rRNA (guanosine(2251)-2'-O)-methyltransferase RlmB [Coprobacillus sp.]